MFDAEEHNRPWYLAPAGMTVNQVYGLSEALATGKNVEGELARAVPVVNQVPPLRKELTHQLKPLL